MEGGAEGRECEMMRGRRRREGVWQYSSPASSRTVSDMITGDKGPGGDTCTSIGITRIHNAQLTNKYII